MSKPIHFIAGLPFAGGTLLANVLAQNPRFYLSAPAGIVDVMAHIRNQWETLGEFRAMPPAEREATKLRVLRGILFSYHAQPAPVAFDRSRGWLSYLEMAEAVLGTRARVLVPVRDLRDVLASLEILWRTISATQQPSQENRFYFEMQTVEGRCAVWVRGDQPVGLAYNRIKGSLQRGLRDRLHFVPYEALTTQPAETLRDIYAFLGEEPFAHDFTRVSQVVHSDDRIFGLPNPHVIRPRMEAAAPLWPTVLGPAAAPYADLSIH